MLFSDKEASRREEGEGGGAGGFDVGGRVPGPVLGKSMMNMGVVQGMCHL